MKKTSALLFAALLSALGTTAEASPVQWTLTDVLFEDGGTATGSFIYDADTNAYSGINITVTDGSLSPIATLTALLAGGNADGAFVPAAGDLTGSPYLQLLYYNGPLTNAGGLVYLIDPYQPEFSSFDGTCSNASCSSATFGRLMIDGGIIGAPAVVPLPGALGLFASAAGLAGALARRRRA